MDRERNIRHTDANTGNVLLTFRDVTEIQLVISHWTNSHPPLYDFTTSDCIRHSMWRIMDIETIEEIVNLFASRVTHTYIADGHHRAAAAASLFLEKLRPPCVSARLPENGQKVPRKIHKCFCINGCSSQCEIPIECIFGDSGRCTAGEGDGFFLTTLFPASQLQTFGYHRVLRDFNGLTLAQFLECVRRHYDVDSAEPSLMAETGIEDVALYAERHWWRLRLKHEVNDSPVERLDISAFSKFVLANILGIVDQRTDHRVDFVGGSCGLPALERLVETGEWKAAVAFPPVPVQQLLEVADSGSLMPPKSTWFEPKLRDGLVSRLLT
eukprot:Gregarina_sp_Poly_1__7275@NODE_39_length_18147_cov_101_572069_g34_i0_p7_GENE_NODE_39_length_18147_cov_101_572069_g34_i0NODE_39_length_18147_cov_101_572069_g34_i0_p7_ORF_typecomplete_len326_score53_53DUF1015/PF06245_11/3_2e69ParBc/PF02195_18/0_22_NODE_39_length_18147_cov_101_572069_g34_i065417518